LSLQHADVLLFCHVIIVGNFLAFSWTTLLENSIELRYNLSGFTVSMKIVHIITLHYITLHYMVTLFRINLIHTTMCSSNAFKGNSMSALPAITINPTRYLSRQHKCLRKRRDILHIVAILNMFLGLGLGLGFMFMRYMYRT
jgi:uncharacterized membrane-anchored protein